MQIVVQAHIYGIQIIPIESYYQPPITSARQVLDIGAFDPADYCIFHVHGGVDVGGTQPRFAGGFYRFTHSIDPSVVGNINRPDMTAANLPAPTVVSASSEEPDHPGWHAADSSDYSTDWQAQDQSAYLEVDFTVPNIVDRYTVRTDGTNAGAPTDFTFQAFDGVNWVVLDTQVAQFAPDTDNLSHNYTVQTPIPATKYRLVVTATKDADSVMVYDLDLHGKQQDVQGTTTFINLPEVGRYKTGEAESAAYTANQKQFHHRGGNMQFAFEDITGHYDDNTSYPGLVPAAEGGASKPIKPVFALINISRITEQAIGAGGLPVLFDPTGGLILQ